MLIYAFLLILLLRPSWGLLGWFTVIAVILWVFVAQLHRPIDLIWNSLGEAAGHAVIFYLVGALVIAVRASFCRGPSDEEKRAERLVARARAEAAKQQQ